MIFVTVGTHPQSFERLIRRIDEIALYVKEKIIVQCGFSNYKPKNVEYFNFKDNLDEYYKKARLVITQSATSLIEFALKYKKPVITVPRQKKYKEHLNDHQVEFADYFSKKTGITSILNIQYLTPELLKKYNKIAILKNDNLLVLQDFFRRVINDT